MATSATSPQSVNEPALLLSPEQTAALLGLSRSRIFALIAAKQLVSIQIGRLRRIPRSACVDWLADEIERQRPPSVTPLRRSRRP